MVFMALMCSTQIFAAKVVNFEENFITAPSETNWGFSTVTGHTFTYDATNKLEQIRWSATSNSTKSISTVTAGTDGKITIETILKFYTNGNNTSGGALYFLDSNHRAIFGIVMRYTSSGYRIAKATAFPGYQTNIGYPTSDNPLLNVVQPLAKVTVVLDMTAKTYSYNVVDGTYDYSTRVFTAGSNSVSLTNIAFLNNTATDFAGLQSNFYQSGTLTGTPGYDLIYMGVSHEEGSAFVSSTTSMTLGNYEPSSTFTVTGTNLTGNINITAPAGIALTGTNVTGSAPNYSIAQANGNGINTITAIWDGITTVNAQNIAFASTGATNLNVSVTSDNAAQFVPTSGQGYYIIQGSSALANANKVIGSNSGSPVLVSALNDNTQQFTFDAVPSTTNQYYIKNANNQYLNFTSGTTVAYGVQNGDYSIWSIKGTTASGIRLINKQAYSYLNSAAVTATTALTVGGTNAATYGSYTLVASNTLYQNYVIDGSFEYAATDGTPLGEWVSSPAKQIGVSGFSRIRTGAAYASAGSSAFTLRFIADANAYTSISNTLTGLTAGHTYTLDFKYKTAQTNEGSIPDAGSVMNVYASNTQNGDLTTALGGSANYVSTTTPLVAVAAQDVNGYVAPTLTFTATQSDFYLVFAKNDNAIYFNTYIDDLKLTDITTWTMNESHSKSIGYLIFRSNQGICVSGLKSLDKVHVYNCNGQLIKNEVAKSNQLNINLETGLYVVKVNSYATKIVL